MKKLTNQVMKQVNGGGYYWKQCEKEVYSNVYKRNIKCGQIYGMTYSWSYFDYKNAVEIVDAALSDHQSNAH